MIRSTAKSERRLRRQTHRRKASKAKVEKEQGKKSGLRKFYPTSSNPRTKHNKSTRTPEHIKAPALEKLFVDVKLAVGRSGN